MKWRVESRDLESLCPADYAACMRLGVEGGLLRSEMRECRSGLTFATVFIVRDPRDGTTVIGWALLSPGVGERKNLMLYVRKAWRRRGVGSALVRKAQFLEPRPLVTTWDLPSRCFFDYLGFKVQPFNLAQFKTSVDPTPYGALEPA